MSARRVALASAVALIASGCAHDQGFLAAAGRILDDAPARVVDAAPVVVDGYPEPVAAPVVHAAAHAVTGSEGPYLLDTGDRLRIFVYGQPNLSRLYTVDQVGMITVPLIGAVNARGLTTFDLESVVRSRLGSEYVRNPQVTVDVQQNRPFFILGEVRNAGQFPYVSGMTIETAVAIAGGYSERASDRSFRITRRIDGNVEQIEAPADYVVKPGDTIYVYERFL